MGGANRGSRVREGHDHTFLPSIEAPQSFVKKLPCYFKEFGHEPTPIIKVHSARLPRVTRW